MFDNAFKYKFYYDCIPMEKKFRGISFQESTMSSPEWNDFWSSEKKLD